MVWTWTHGGKSFGYREDDELWTFDGRHVGHFDGEDIYGPGGGYLGEIYGGRLITCLSKKGWAGNRFTPFGYRVGYVPYVNYVGFVMLVGYEDFPGPNDL